MAQIDSATSFWFFDKKDGLPATTDEWCASFSFFGNPALENVNLQVFHLQSEGFYIGLVCGLECHIPWSGSHY